VTAKDILSDLVRSVETASSLSGQSKETTPWTNRSQGQVSNISSAESIPEGGLPRVTSLSFQASENANKVPEAAERQADLREECGLADDGWAAFDDCPPFDTSLFPSHILDKNGFPMVNLELTTVDVHSDENVTEADDDFTADEKELAAQLIREMKDEIANDGHEDYSNGSRIKSSLSRARFVASQVAKIEGRDAEKISRRIELQQQGRQEEASMREQEHQRLTETAKQRGEENERVEQFMAKELARRIAKEQEWGKLQEMAEELARKQLEAEKLQQNEQTDQFQQFLDQNVRCRPCTTEEADLPEHKKCTVDESSSLPVSHPIESKSLSQCYTSESRSPAQSEKAQRHQLPSATLGERESSPPASSPRKSSIEKREVQPNSPSSVVDFNSMPVRNTTDPIGSTATIATQRFRQTMVVFSNRQTKCSPPATRPKPTWNPKPPKHYNRTLN
jgi:hypothetical protein